VSAEKLKLNLGCGSRPRAGFVNVDSQAACCPDLVLDLEKTPWPWADDAADEIDLIHVLEHLGQSPAVYLAIVRELWRVCCDGARVRIIVPHPRSDEFLNDPTHVRPITAGGLEMFSQRRNAEWAAMGAANTPLGRYLGIDFEIESSALDLRPVWQQRLQNGEVSEAEVRQAGEQQYNVFSQLTVVLRAVKPAGGGVPATLPEAVAAARSAAGSSFAAPSAAEVAAHQEVVAALAAGDFAGALAVADAAFAASPQSLEARALLATAQHAAGQLEAACENFRACAERGFGGLELQNNLGVVALDLGRADDAIAAFESALAHDEGNPAVRANLAEALGVAGRIQDAVALYEQLLQQSPQAPALYLGIARLFNAQGWFADALGTLDAGLALAGNDPELLNQKGIALRELGRADAALAAFEAALAVDPENAGLTANRAAALARLGRDVEAETAFRAAAGASPEAAFAYACFLLKRARTDEGWPYYDARRRVPGIRRHPLEDRLPPWRGEAAAPGARLLVTAEQGFGDNLQFARLLPRVAERFGGRVCLLTRPALLALLQRSLQGVCEVVDAVADDDRRFDLVCPIASLPLALSLPLAEWGMDAPYLKADAMQAALWGFRIPAGPQRKIGFCRSGGKAARFRHRCDLPLPAAERLLAAGDAVWLSLQKDGDDAWRQAQVAAGRLVDLMAQVRQFDDSAALVANLDLVITVDTAIVHLAGALGKPVWLLLDHDADWRWLAGRDDTPWYPSMRLFRQSAPGDWDGVVARVLAALAEG